ncbi:MAG: CPBP family glutamic-type intramembrane protease [Caulobacteraceae bacterium]
MAMDIMPLAGVEPRSAFAPPTPVASVLAFFGLTFLLTAPLWAISSALGLQILPGLPVAAVAVICPALAAIIMTCRRGGWAGGRALLMRAVDGRRVPAAWWPPIVLICPAVAVLMFLILRLGGSGVPNPEISIVPALALAALFLVSALSEELGWSGFALGPLQACWGPLRAAFALGGIWAIWHYPALLQAHRPLAWIAWWTLGTVAMRVIMVWLYNGAKGSVFAVAVFHAVSNLGWQLFPLQGSWFNPRLHGLLMSGVALILIVVTLGRLRRDRDGARFLA